MHSTLSQPYTSLLHACWTLARTPRLLATYGLYLIPCTATSAHGSCKLRLERTRPAAHFFPHTRPPDTHALDVGTSCLEYRGSLVNTYSSLVLRSMPNKQRGRRTNSPRPAVARPRDGLDLLDDNTLDEAIDRVSDDGARDMTMSFPHGGSGVFGSRRHDRDSSHSSSSPAARGAAHGGFGSRRHDWFQARRPLLVEAPPAGAMPATATTMMNVAATPLGRKGISPLTKLSASAK